MKKCFIFLVAILCLLSLTACGDPVADVLADIDSGDYQEAGLTYNAKIEGNSEKETAILSALQDQITASYDNYNLGDRTYEEALSLLDTIQKSGVMERSELYDAYDRLERLSASKQSYITACENAATGQEEQAILYYEKVIPEDAYYKTAQEEAKESRNAYVGKYVAEAEEFYGNGEYRKACEVLENISSYSGHADWIQEYSKILTAWEEDVIARAQALYDESKDYKGAIQLLQNDGPGTDAITAEMERYQSYVPILLTSLDYMKKGKDIDIDGNKSNYATDMLGNVYNSIIYPRTNDTVYEDTARWYTHDEKDYCITYSLQEKYSTLSGTLYRTETSLASVEDDWAVPTTFEVYGDGVLLYEGPTITQSTNDPIPFSVDVTGVRELKIVMCGYWADVFPFTAFVWGSPRYCAGDLMLTKQLNV